MEETHSYHVFLVWAALTASEKTGRTYRESIGGESRSFVVHGTVNLSISFRARVRPDKTRRKRKGGCGIYLLFPHGSGNYSCLLLGKKNNKTKQNTRYLVGVELQTKPMFLVICVSCVVFMDIT